MTNPFERFRPKVHEPDFEEDTVPENDDVFNIESIGRDDPRYRDPGRPPKKRLGRHPDKPHGYKNTKGHR